MAQGMRGHWHQFYEDHYEIKYDDERHCDKKIVFYRCVNMLTCTSASI